MNQRSFRVRLLLLLMLLLASLLAACQPGGLGNPHEVVYWTSDTGEPGIQAERRIVDTFNALNPGLHVRLVTVPDSGTTITSLLTAVRGGTGPDVYYLDRFTTNQYAAIGLLQDLQPLIAKHDPHLSEQYLPFTWQEASYRGHPYALPMDADVRALYYNKDVLRQAGIDPALLDPARGPMTLDQLRQLAFRINRVDTHGRFERVGFIPWYDQGGPTTWGIGYGARFYDPIHCEVTPTEPAMVAALQFTYDWAAKMTREQVDTFLATYQPTSAPPSQNAFFTGQIAMTVNGNWLLANIRNYAPQLHYGVTYIPVPHAGQPPYSWSGGSALVLPKGARNAEGAYRFMRFMTGPVGQRIYSQITAQLPAWTALLDDPSLFNADNEFFVKSLRFSRSRVPLPVGLLLWNELNTAQDKVVLHATTPLPALQMVYYHVQPQLQQYCPLT